MPVVVFWAAQVHLDNVRMHLFHRYNVYLMYMYATFYSPAGNTCFHLCIVYLSY